MTLKEFIDSIPLGGRMEFRKALAKAHGKSVDLVRKWGNYPPPEGWSKEKVRKMSRAHPADMDSIRITEAMTNNQVTRYDLRPEIFGASME